MRSPTRSSVAESAREKWWFVHAAQSEWMDWCVALVCGERGAWQMYINPRFIDLGL